MGVRGAGATAGGLLPSAGSFPVNMSSFSGIKKEHLGGGEENHTVVVECETRSYFNTTQMTGLCFFVVFLLTKDPLIVTMYF